LGRPSEQIAKNYEIAQRAFQQLTEDTRAGADATAADGCLKTVPSAAARQSLQAYGLGNGLGLDLCEEPYLGKAEGVAIKPEMALTLRTCFTDQEAGSALISRPYLVTESGLESLAHSEGDLIAIGD
jgi:Xaa-Pro aminopeptidase